MHSGDSSCVLPPTSLTPTELLEIRRAVRRLAPALGVVGLLNVQLALVDDELYVLEANPRASRTVPFASKAIGSTSSRWPAGWRPVPGSSELPLPPEGAERHVSVKAAVFPFSRFPGADPVLGPEMRSTGEVMASAADFPTAFAKAERAAGQARFRKAVSRSSRCATPTSPRRSGSPRGLASLGFALCATAGTADALIAGGLAVERVRKVGEDGRRADGRRPDPPRPLRSRRQHAPGRGSTLRRLPDPRRGSRRADSVHHDHRRRRSGGRGDRAGASRGRRLASGTCCELSTRVTGVEGVGPYRLLRVERGGLQTRALPGSSSCSKPRGGCCRVPMSLCLESGGELGFLLDPVGPGTRSLAACEPGERIRVLGPARQRLRPRRRPPGARRRRHRHRAAPVPLPQARRAACRARLSHRLACRGG